MFWLAWQSKLKRQHPVWFILFICLFAYLFIIINLFLKCIGFFLGLRCICFCCNALPVSANWMNKSFSKHKQGSHCISISFQRQRIEIFTFASLVMMLWKSPEELMKVSVCVCSYVCTWTHTRTYQETRKSITHALTYTLTPSQPPLGSCKVVEW